MSSAPSVDVLLPTLDRPEALTRAIASVDRVRQAEPGLDIRVQVIDREAGSTRGAAAARNLAAAQGEADYLAFLDDDDEWIAPRLGRAIEVLAARPKIALVCGDAELSSGGRFLKVPPAGAEDRGHGALCLDCFVATSTVTIRRKDFMALGGMDESLDRAEDYDLWLRLTRNGGRVHVLGRPVARLEQGEDRLSSDLSGMAADTLRALHQSSSMAERDPLWRDRLGRLEAVLSHGLSKEGRFDEARDRAFRAVTHSPKARVAWTSALRSLLRLRR